MRDSFVFYRSFFEAIKQLDADDRLEIYDAICDYALNQNETKMKPVGSAIFALIKPLIDANNKRYSNGKKGGRPTKKKPTKNQTETKTEPNVNVNDNDNVNENENANGRETKRFTPPTIEEVRDYCNSRNSSVDPKLFYDYFNTGGWKDSKGNKVRNWKQKLITWENHNTQRPTVEDNTVPVYDDSGNVTMTGDELNGILKEMNRA